MTCGLTAPQAAISEAAENTYDAVYAARIPWSAAPD
jgi:hypothetical protein